MAWPPGTLTARTDASPGTPDAHAADHTEERNAINDIVTRLTGGYYVPQAGSYSASSDDVLTSKVTGDGFSRLVVNADGKIEWGTGGGATDAFLERTGVGVVGVTNYLQVQREINARQGQAGLVSIGAAGPASQAGLAFGSSLDVNLYRSAADTLRTSDALDVDGVLRSFLGVTAVATGAAETKIGNVGPSSEAGILFGNAGDTNLYRQGANTLKTDDSLIVQQATGSPSLQVQNTGNTGKGAIAKFIGTATGTVWLNSASLAIDNILTFGASDDVNLYRSAADVLKTDDAFSTGDDVFVRSGGAAEVVLGARGPSSQAAITFGSARDTNLYRSAADQLKTDDAFIAASIQTGQLEATGVIYAYNTVSLAGGSSHIKWDASLIQTTVGAAGPASALPATPTKYLKVKDSAGTVLVIPAYAA